MREAHPVDAGRVERIAGARAQSPLVEHVGDLRVGVLVEERVDLSPYVVVGDSELLSRQGARQRQRSGGTAPEADGGGDLPLLDERDILDEQAEHPFALALRRIRVTPGGRKVRGEERMR